MKYEQPYGISDTNASYINGNPSTGTMGSIPPAASIENPQREIVNFVNASAFSPTDADLFQLAKSVQSGLVNYGADVGSPNQIAIAPVVPISKYAVGQRFIIKMAYGNTSHVTVNISGLGQVPVIHVDQTPINPYELIAGQLIEIAFDGANFEVIAGAGIGGAVTMTAPQNLYVNANTGSDAIYDGTSATVGSGSVGPFKTVEKALHTMAKYNLGGWNFNIYVADGVYTTTTGTYFPLPNGSGQVNLIGNTTNPANVSIFNTGAGSCWLGVAGGQYSINGFSFRATAPAGGDGGNGIWFGGANVLTIGKCIWNSVPGIHIQCGPAGTVYITDDMTISGPAISHMTALFNAIIYNSKLPIPPNLTITSPVTMSSGFAVSNNGAQIQCGYGTITGAGSVTGPKYLAYANGVVNTLGGGASYLPGSSPGSVSSGGQYL